MLSQIRPAVVSFVMLTLITGLIYPLTVTSIAQVAFRHGANGSVIELDGQAIGSELIAQPFTEAKYFWPRPSAANYNGAGGAGSNLSPTNPAQLDLIRQRTDALRAANPGQTGEVPFDLVTASASGLDPHISAAAAQYQAMRVAQARDVPVRAVRELVAANTETRTLGVFGEARVNVLKLNLGLDALTSRANTIGAAHP